MGEKERLMVTAMEECAEIQQGMAKALNFGVNNHHPDEPCVTNGYRVMKEFYQLKAVMDMLVIKRYIPPISEEEQHQIYRDKIDDIEKWENYSKSIVF